MDKPGEAARQMEIPLEPFWSDIDYLQSVRVLLLNRWDQGLPLPVAILVPLSHPGFRLEITADRGTPPTYRAVYRVNGRVDGSVELILEAQRNERPVVSV